MALPLRGAGDRIISQNLRSPVARAGANRMRRFVVMSWNGSTRFYFYVEARSASKARELVDMGNAELAGDLKVVTVWTPRELRQLASDAAQEEPDLREKEVEDD